MNRGYAAILTICGAIAAVPYFAACASTHALNGMLYDQDARPVPNYELVLDGKARTYTDVNGRFDFPKVKIGTHIISGDDARYEAIRATCEFRRVTDIAHVRATSIDGLYRAIDESLGLGDLQAAAYALARMPPSERASPDYGLYAAIYRFRSSGDAAELEGIAQ